MQSQSLTIVGSLSRMCTVRQGFVSLGVSLVDKGWTAVEEASDFAVYSSQTDSWFREVAEATDPDDPIVLAYRSNTVNAYSIQVALRVYYILNRCYDRGNVYFCLIPPEPTIAPEITTLGPR